MAYLVKGFGRSLLGVGGDSLARQMEGCACYRQAVKCDGSGGIDFWAAEDDVTEGAVFEREDDSGATCCVNWSEPVPCLGGTLATPEELAAIDYLESCAACNYVQAVNCLTGEPHDYYLRSVDAEDLFFTHGDACCRWEIVSCLPEGSAVGDPPDRYYATCACASTCHESEPFATIAASVQFCGGGNCQNHYDLSSSRRITPAVVSIGASITRGMSGVTDVDIDGHSWSEADCAGDIEQTFTTLRLSWIWNDNFPAPDTIFATIDTVPDGTASFEVHWTCTDEEWVETFRENCGQRYDPPNEPPIGFVVCENYNCVIDTVAIEVGA